MLTQGTLKIEEAISEEVLVIDEHLKIVDLYINTLEYEDNGQSVETQVKVEDEMMPQLPIHIIKQNPAQELL